MGVGPTQFPVAAGTPTVIDLRQMGLSSPCEAELQNESPLTLTVTIGDRSVSLGAWKAQKYELAGVAQIRVDAQQIQSPAPSGVPSSVVIVTAIDEGEPCLVGSWPYDLGRMVAIQAGSVTITGTPSVTIASGTVNIGNTPTVILGAGTANVGSISGISGTVTVAGTVNIGNTPSVTISGTPNVNISSGTVSITGTPNINIQSQSVTLQTQQSQVAVGSTINGATNFATNPSWHSIGIQIITTKAGQTLSVKGATSGIEYCPPWLQGPLNVTAGQKFIFPIAPIDPATDVNITVTCNQSGQRILGILDTSATEVFTLSGQGLAVQALAYDATGLSAPASGTQASVVLAATTGKAYTAAALAAAIQAGVATAFAVDIELLDGVTVIFQHMLGAPATIGSQSEFNETMLGYKGTAGNSMTWKFANSNANDLQRVNIGAYLRS